MPAPSELEAEGWIPVRHNGGFHRLLMEELPCRGVGLYIHPDKPLCTGPDGREMPKEAVVECGRCHGDILPDLQLAISAMMDSKRQ